MERKRWQRDSGSSETAAAAGPQETESKQKQREKAQKSKILCGNMDFGGLMMSKMLKLINDTHLAAADI